MIPFLKIVLSGTWLLFEYPGYLLVLGAITAGNEVPRVKQVTRPRITTDQDGKPRRWWCVQLE